MKHLKKLLVATLMFAGMTSQAQDSNNPWAISFGANGVDTKVSAVGNDSPKWIQLGNARENWNFIPSVSYLNLSRYVGDGFSFGLTGSVNKIDKMVYRVPGTGSTDVVVNPVDLSYYAADATIKYSFMEMIGTKWFDPSLNLGGGYTFFGDASAGTVNGGLGFTFWFSEQVGLQLQSTYTHSFDDNRVGDIDVPSHIQHFAGLTFKFGGKDTDGDGIYDKDDACPEVAGLPEFKGCPDTDKDGIQDSEDACPEEVGTKELNGCPDNDGDGIINSEDACPDDKGTKMMNGCPDADGDGVADKDDKCPTVAGTVANNGCPEVSDDTMKKLNDYGKTILFNSGKASFQKQTIPVLQAMTAILKEYPTAKFSLEGHTDSTGADALNQKLSEERAAAVKNFLVENGIDASRLSSKGFGESMPVDSNKTAKGKANNRRVEVKLVK